MSEPLYDIVFYGILQPGKDRAQVEQNMAQLFKVTPDKVKPSFNEVNQAQQENVGLVIKLEEVSAAQPESEAAATPAAAASPGDDIDTGDISMAEVGADVIEHPVAVEAQPIGDISDLSMAELGADVIEHPVPVEAQVIDDISELSMAEVGADMVENPVPVEAQAIDDISDMSMAEVGADVYAKPPKKPETPDIDISELSADSE